MSLGFQQNGCTLGIETKTKKLEIPMVDAFHKCYSKNIMQSLSPIMKYMLCDPKPKSQHLSFNVDNFENFYYQVLRPIKKKKKKKKTQNLITLRLLNFTIVNVAKINEHMQKLGLTL